MSYIPNVGLGTLAGGAAALGAATTGFQAGKAVYNAASGASTHGKDASYIQTGINAAIGNTADKTQQAVRHLVEAGLWTAPTVGLAASAAATLDSKGEYTFGLGSIGLDLNKVSLPSVFGDSPSTQGWVDSALAIPGNIASYVGSNPGTTVGGLFGGALLLYGGVKCVQHYRSRAHGG